jgi:hypothetical protein
MNKRKYTKPESMLRDYLANRLALIENGLTLVRTEYPLNNPEGAKGFIDILARDVFGHRVVIEIKRSDATARQAIHELHKYVELLQKHQGLSNGEVRCILVSTDWHELTPAFTAFQRSAPYPVDGYEVIMVKEKPERLRKVEQLPSPVPLQPFRLHGAFLFETEKKKLAFKPKLKKALVDLGISSAVILGMSTQPDRDHVVYPHCVYLMICDLTDEARRQGMRKAKKEASGTPAEDDIAFLFEDSVMCEVVKRTAKTRDTFECSYPEKFAAEFPFWSIDTIERTGRLTDDGMTTDDDLMQHLLGHTGTGQIAYNGIASPAFPAAWESAKARTRRCLLGNDVWAAVAEHVLGLIERNDGRTAASFHIYNPCDTVMMLFQLQANDDPRFVPAMEIMWKSEANNVRHIVSGVVGWDGRTKPTNPKHIMNRVFDDDSNYFLARVLGATVDFEKRLMKRHGLSYHVSHWAADTGDAEGKWLTKRGSKFKERPLESQSPVPLRSFVAENEVYLNALVEWFRSLSFGV